MDFPLFIRQRLKELKTEQRDLATAARVTESYISQLLTGKKAPPAPERTEIYVRMETFLRLPAGKLAAIGVQRKAPVECEVVAGQELADLALLAKAQILQLDGNHDGVIVVRLDEIEVGVFPARVGKKPLTECRPSSGKRGDLAGGVVMSLET